MNGIIKTTCAGLIVSLAAVGCSVSDDGSIGPASFEESGTKFQYGADMQNHAMQRPAVTIADHRTAPHASGPNMVHSPAAGRSHDYSQYYPVAPNRNVVENSVAVNQQPAATMTTVRTQPQPVQAQATQRTGATTQVQAPLAHDEPMEDTGETGSIRSHTAPALVTVGQVTQAERQARRNSFDNMSQETFTRIGADFDITVDPSGKYLAYASTQHTDTADIYIKQAKAQSITQFTNDPGNDVMPAFSPDSQWVAFASDRSGNWDLYVKNINGSKAIKLTNGAAHELHPSWHPNGKQIVFSALNEQSGEWEMVMLDINKPNNRRYLGKGLFPVFSPDGTKLLFQKARERGSRLFGVWTLTIVNGEGIHPTEIAASKNAAVITPCWSPTGNRIAFVTVVDPPKDPTVRPKYAALWVCNADGTNRVNLTNDRYVNLQPAWSKDGMLYFVSNRTVNDNIWSIRPEKAIDASGGPEVKFEPAPKRDAGSITINNTTKLN